MPICPFTKKFRDFVVEHQFFKADERVVIGCSGGPDSVALLRLTLDVSRLETLNLQVHVAHLNHKLRGAESDEDEAFVRDLAGRLDASFDVEERPLGEIHAETDGTLEEVARQERFKFFQRVAYRTDSKKVLLAHQADDNAETILQRIVRGTGLRGLAGIHMRRELFDQSGIELLRPMLCFTRAEIGDYLASINQPYRLDSSNATPNHTRNRIRNQVMPLLAQSINPRVRQALLRLSEQAALANDYLADTARRTLETLVIDRSASMVSLNRNGLIKKSLPVQAEVLRQAILSFGLGEQDIAYEHIRALLRLAEHGTGGRRIDLPGGLQASQQYNRLVFLLPDHPEAPAVAEPIMLNIPGEVTLPALRMRIRCEPVSQDIESLATFKKRKNKNEEWVDLTRVQPPLLIRCRKPGDRFWPLGAPGAKRLTDFFSHCQIQNWQRDRVPVLCDSFGPLWVIPYRIDERVRITRTTTQVLHLIVEEVTE